MSGECDICGEHALECRCKMNIIKQPINQQELFYNYIMLHKKELIDFMHVCGFEWICDIAYINGIEMVASKYIDCEKLWWRPIHVEGSGFERLFKDSIKKIMKN